MLNKIKLFPVVKTTQMLMSDTLGLLVSQDNVVPTKCAIISDKHGRPEGQIKPLMWISTWIVKVFKVWWK